MYFFWIARFLNKTSDIFPGSAVRSRGWKRAYRRLSPLRRTFCLQDSDDRCVRHEVRPLAGYDRVGEDGLHFDISAAVFRRTSATVVSGCWQISSALSAFQSRLFTSSDKTTPVTFISPGIFSPSQTACRQARRREGLRSFPWPHPSGSSYPRSDRRPPSGAVRSPSLAS